MLFSYFEHEGMVSSRCEVLLAYVKVTGVELAIYLAKYLRFNHGILLMSLSLCRDLAAQQTDTEGSYFDERLRERELARKAAARSPMDFERTKEYERDY